LQDDLAKRRRKRLPIAPDVTVPEIFKPKRSDWQRIQDSFGVRLGPTHRAEITVFANDYFFAHELERSAPFAADGIAWLRKLRLSLNQALSIMRKKPDTPYLEREAEDYARVNMVALFRKYRGEASWTWGQILDVVAQLERASSDVLQDFETLKDGFKEGSAWNLLVFRLTELADKNHFPSRVAKGGRSSPFVKFMRELQKTFPEKFRKHLHSDTALAQAILRARRIQNANSDVEPK
jgi:hypothetical protein